MYVSENTHITSQPSDGEHPSYPGGILEYVLVLRLGYALPEAGAVGVPDHILQLLIRQAHLQILRAGSSQDEQGEST